MKDVYTDIKKLNGVFEAKGEKNFTFLHVSGCHNAKYDEHWNKTTLNNKDVLVSAKNSMELVSLYLRGIKSISEELYRNSTIIILGDHGKVLDPIKDFSASMMAALFVKPAGESGTPLRISSAPVAHENVWATIFESEGIDYDKNAFAPSVFEVERSFHETGEYPERKFIWTKRKIGMTSYDTVEYCITGPAKDFSSWRVHARNHYDNTLFH
jgi:hypothetical protein